MTRSRTALQYYWDAELRNGHKRPLNARRVEYAAVFLFNSRISNCNCPRYEYRKYVISSSKECCTHLHWVTTWDIQPSSCSCWLPFYTRGGHDLRTCYYTQSRLRSFGTWCLAVWWTGANFRTILPPSFSGRKTSNRCTCVFVDGHCIRFLAWRWGFSEL